MPRVRLTKRAIDALQTSQTDTVYWDASFPGFGVKVTPKGPPRASGVTQTPSPSLASRPGPSHPAGSRQRLCPPRWRRWAAAAEPR